MRDIGPPELFILLGILLIGLIPFFFYCRTLSGALRLCPPASRTMQPGKVWLLFIPLFGLVWHFFVVNGIAKSLGNEFRRLGILPEEPEPGKTLGLALCILLAASIIPLAGVVASLAGFVVWILYWVKIANYAGILRRSQTTGSIQNIGTPLGA